MVQVLIDWEAKEVQQQIQKLAKGCCCKTGCKTKLCQCKKNAQLCGAGCECRGCTNFPQPSSAAVPHGDELRIEIEDEDELNNEEDKETDNEEEQEGDSEQKEDTD